MKLSTNALSVASIVASTILLIGLELLWLTKEYREETIQFHREAHMMFRNTVFELQDSLAQKSLVQIDLTQVLALNDSTGTLPENKVPKFKGDSSAHIIFLQGKVDDLTRGTKKMMVRLHYDSIDHDLIVNRFRNDMIDAGIDLPVHLTFIDDLKEGPPIFLQQDIVRTPSGAFKLEFSDLNWLIVRKMSPQILFTLFLTLLVIGSFALLYRNLRLQQRLVTIKDGLISNISHELKTPITTVGVALEGLRNFTKEGNTKMTSDYIDIAEHELARLSMLTEKVLNASLNDQKVAPANFTSFEFDELVYEVGNSFKLIADKMNAKIEIEKLSDSMTVTADRGNLATVLFNLIDNALKYSGNEAKVRILLHSDEDNLVLQVQDNGIGIPSEYHDKIFEKFFRVPTGDLHVVKGYGLGLDFVKQVVNAHRGNIKVESESGQGATITITIPRHGKI